MNENIDAIFDLLDKLMANNEMKYSAYSALHDQISFLSDSLKEQEPKKVKTDMYGNAYCPWCSTEKTIEMGLRKLHLGTNYCPWCGREVKWE